MFKAGYLTDLAKFRIRIHISWPFFYNCSCIICTEAMTVYSAKDDHSNVSYYLWLGMNQPCLQCMLLAQLIAGTHTPFAFKRSSFLKSA